MKFNSGIIRYNLIQDCLYSYVHYSMGGGYFQFSNNVFLPQQGRQWHLQL